MTLRFSRSLDSVYENKKFGRSSLYGTGVRYGFRHNVFLRAQNEEETPQSSSCAEYPPVED